MDLSDIETCYNRQKECIKELRDREDQLAVARDELRTHVKKEKQILAQIRTAERQKQEGTKDEIDDRALQNPYWDAYLAELSKLHLNVSMFEACKEELNKQYKTRQQYLSYMKTQMTML